jgi:hypothetical protein
MQHDVHFLPPTKRTPAEEAVRVLGLLLGLRAQGYEPLGQGVPIATLNDGLRTWELAAHEYGGAFVSARHGVHVTQERCITLTRETLIELRRMGHIGRSPLE